MPEPRTIRIFVSSPSDVDEERRRMMEVIAVLNRRYAGVIKLDGVFWEQTVYPAHATFQAQIEEPASCDLVICILWSRLGSPLPVGWPTRPEGEPYESGTVYEFETALAARRLGAMPDIYVFRKLLPEDRAALDQLMERHPAEKLRILDYLIRRGSDDSRAAIELLERFWANWFYSPDKGFIAAFNTFATADNFAELARLAIDDWLVGKGLVTAQPDWDIAHLGSPYPGLAPFDDAHTAVFFGRARVIDRALALFRGAAEAAFPWLLLTGPSGGGKSSLLRAGIVPALTEQTVLETWRVATVRPGADDPLGVLLGAIAGGDVLGPALAEGDYPTAADLARIARLAPGELARPLLRALDRRAETVREQIARNTAPLSRLLLVIDQLEEILLAPAERQAEFGAVLTALLDGGESRIWIAASLRSDLQEPFLKIASFQPLLTLDHGGRELKLAAPGPADMREVIEGPAARAGLGFETRESDGRSLAEELVAAVGNAADALPLLQMTLALLFDRRDPAHKLLRWSDYEAMGGLEGAIANQAEAVLRVLPASVGDELGPLLRQLTRAWLSLDGEIELRPAELDEGGLSGPRAELAAAFVAGRLLVADQGKLRIVHEAVLRHWGRARELLSADLDLARLKSRLEPLAAEWTAAGRDPNDDARLLPPGAQLAAADAAVKRYPVEEIGAELAAFVAASVVYERRRRTRRQRILAITAAIFAGLAVLAMAGGLVAWHERGVATAALDESQRNYELALTQAAGSVRSLADGYEAGAVSSTVMRQLIDKAQTTVANLPRGGDDVTAAQAKLLGVLTIGNMTLGNIPLARQYADRERALTDSLVARDPNRVEWRRLWASARTHSASALFWQGDAPQAVELAKQAIAETKKLADAEPQDDGLHFDLMIMTMNLGDSLRGLGDLEGADRAYRDWVAEAEAAAAREPDNVDWPRHLAFAHQRFADDAMVLGKPDEAEKEYRIEAEIGGKLLAKDPGNGLFGEAVGLAHERLGDTYLARDEFDKAEAAYRQSIDDGAKLLVIDPTNYRWRALAATAHQRLGELALKRADYATAEAEFGLYSKAAEETLRKDLGNNPGLYDAGNAEQEIGDALRGAGKLDEALAHYRKALAHAEELDKRVGTNPPWRKLLAAVHQRIGLTLDLQGDRAGAGAEFHACVAIPVKPTIFTPKLLWPRDVNAYCAEQLARLGD